MIISFKDDAFAAAANVSKLTRLLDVNTSTPESHYNACVILHKLADREASRNSLAYYPQIVESLVHLLQTTQDINVQTEAAMALRKLCYAKPTASAVRSVLSVADLVQLLSHPAETIFVTALSILHRQMLFIPEETRPEVKSAGGPVQLAALLTPERLAEPGYLAICADALRMTAYEDPQVKLILLDCDIAEKIVYLLNAYRSHEKLQHALTRLIKVLSVSTDCKQGLVEAGAVQAMTGLLNSSHSSLILETLWGLRNLSDQAFHLTDTRELFTLLVPLVSSSVEHIAICAVGCLCNLTCQNASNKATLIEIDGVSALCGCLTTFVNRDEVTEPVCSALRNLTHQNEHASLAIHQIHDFGVLKVIVSLLKSDQFPAHLPLVKAVTGLVRNLGLSKSCRRDLHQLGATDRLIILFQRASGVFEEATQQRASILSNSSELSYIEGVRIEDFIELLLVALQSMAQHTAARLTIIHSPEGVFASLVQYLYSGSEYIQRASLELLNEVTLSPEGALAVEQAGAVARITELVHSDNPKTATYSASILHRVAGHLKPAEYQKRLSKELKNCLRDAGVLPVNSSPSPATPVAPAKVDDITAPTPPRARTPAIPPIPVASTGSLARRLPDPPQNELPLPLPRSRTILNGIESIESVNRRHSSRLSLDEPRVYLDGREATQLI
nr:armadillo segment polarity protein [Hymenolepis microstoma]